MLTINPTDPSLVAWPGLDTLIRRVVLRRPEEASAAPNAFGVVSPGAPPLEGPDLSWYRIASRDVGPKRKRSGTRPFWPPGRLRRRRPSTACPQIDRPRRQHPRRWRFPA